MATPQYPAILTEADWKKNKSLKTTVGHDTIGKQLGLVAVAHKGTLWQLFDLQKMPPTGKDKAGDIQAALGRAQAEYDKNVKLLLGRLKVLEDEVKKQQGKAKSDYLTRLAAAITQYSAQVQLVQAEFKSFEAARDAAQLAQGQEDEGDEDEPDEADEADEPESLDPEKNKPVLVKDVIGRQFFADLEKITFYRDDDVRRWTEDTSLLLSPKDKRPINELKDAQEKGAKALLAFVAALAELRSLGEASLPPAQGIKKTKLAWKKARAAFDKPGFKSGAYNFYERKQIEAIGQAGVDDWNRQNSAQAQLHRKVGDILSENHKIISNLERLVFKAQVK